MRKRLYKCFSVIICVLFLLLPVFSALEPGAMTAQAGRTLLLSQAKALALSKSEEYKRTKSKIALTQVTYTEAVKTIKLKKENMSTFRWSPLLSFTFPTKPDLAEEYEFTYKPLSIQAEISTLQHQLSDQVYAVYENVSNLYTQCYTAQEKLVFEENQLALMEKNLEKNRARLLTGEASQSDIDTMEMSISTLKKTIAADMKTLEKAKQKLTDMIKLDVTSGYTFQNPYQDLQVGREKLDALVERTLENSQTYFEAKMTSQLALISLDTNYSLMKSQYGDKMGVITAFINQAKSGEEMDESAFKSAYDQLIYAVDSPWQGSKRILFIKIPKVWFKGAIDGVRYIEDEPYALYTSALEYQEALKDQEDARKEIENEVRESFDALVTARNSYLSIKEQVELSGKNLEKAEYLNMLGEMSYEEYADAQQEYQEYQMDALESLDFYTQSLYSFDRLTCGGITAMMEEGAFSLNAAAGGISYVEEETEEGAYYYIQSKVEDNVFELGIYLPEDYEIDVTDFELWCDGIRIGERTPIGKTLRHLTLSVENLDRVWLRLYNDGEFVDDCDIEPSKYYGELSVTGSYRTEETTGKKTTGTYTYSTNQKTGITTLTLNLNEEEGIGFYRIEDANGNSLFSAKLVQAGSPFQYLTLLLSNLEEVVLKCYDNNQEALYDAYFDTATMTIYREYTE